MSDKLGYFRRVQTVKLTKTLRISVNAMTGITILGGQYSFLRVFSTNSWFNPILLAPSFLVFLSAGEVQVIKQKRGGSSTLKKVSRLLINHFFEYLLACLVVFFNN